VHSAIEASLDAGRPENRRRVPADDLELLKPIAAGVVSFAESR